MVGADGALAPGHEPVTPRGQTDLAMDAAALRVVPVRATTAGSVLVREGVAAPPPGGIAAGLTWTAGLLRDRPGFLVPDSLAAPAARAPYARRTAALLIGGGLDGRDRLRLALDAAERAIRTPAEPLAQPAGDRPDALPRDPLRCRKRRDVCTTTQPRTTFSAGDHALPRIIHSVLRRWKKKRNASLVKSCAAAVRCSTTLDGTKSPCSRRSTRAVNSMSSAWRKNSRRGRP